MYIYIHMYIYTYTYIHMHISCMRGAAARRTWPAPTALCVVSPSIAQWWGGSAGRHYYGCRPSPSLYCMYASLHLLVFPGRRARCVHVWLLRLCTTILLSLQPCLLHLRFLPCYLHFATQYRFFISFASSACSSGRTDLQLSITFIRFQHNVCARDAWKKRAL